MLNHRSGNLASNGKSARLSRGKVLQRNRTGYEDGNAYARQYSKVDLRTRINEHAILQHVSTNTQDAVLHSVVVCLLDMWGEEHVVMAMETRREGTTRVWTTRMGTSGVGSFEKRRSYSPPSKLQKAPLPRRLATVDFKWPCPPAQIHDPHRCPWRVIGRGPE